jgi:Domain of unknown function (DUF4158)
MATRVFSDEELAQLRNFPEITRDELIRFFTLPSADRAFVDPGRGRSARDRLGLAVQLCTLPWLGFVPDDVTAAPPAAVGRLADQLCVDANALAGDGEREQARTDHLRLVLQYSGWRLPRALEIKELEEFLLARAMEHDSPSLLFRLACEHLRTSQVVRPGVVTLIERVAAARARAERETYDRLAHLLTDARRAELDGLLVTDTELGMARLRWLNTGPPEASAAAAKTEVRKLFLRGLDAHTLHLSTLPAERRRFLAAVGRRSSMAKLTRREPHRRYPIVLTVLAQSAVDVLDEVVQLFDQASARESRAKHKLADRLAERAKRSEDKPPYRRQRFFDTADARRSAVAAGAWAHVGCRGDSRQPAGGYVGVCLSAAHALEYGVGGALTVGAHRGSLRDGHRHREARDRGRTA